MKVICPGRCVGDSLMCRYRRDGKDKVCMFGDEEPEKKKKKKESLFGYWKNEGRKSSGVQGNRQGNRRR